MRNYAIILFRDNQQRTVIKMKNFTKILCVVLALVAALSVASCSLTKQYAYQKDDIELPIGVYVYYMYSSYNEAQTLAQKSDLYDAATGKYDGKKSFLKMEITDDMRAKLTNTKPTHPSLTTSSHLSYKNVCVASGVRLTTRRPRASYLFSTTFAPFDHTSVSLLAES